MKTNNSTHETINQPITDSVHTLSYQWHSLIKYLVTLFSVRAGRVPLLKSGGAHEVDTRQRTGDHLRLQLLLQLNRLKTQKKFEVGRKRRVIKREMMAYTQTRTWEQRKLRHCVPACLWCSPLGVTTTTPRAQTLQYSDDKILICARYSSFQGAHST